MSKHIISPDDLTDGPVTLGAWLRLAARFERIEWKWRLISLRARAGATLLRLGLGPRPPYGHMTLDRWMACGFHEAGARTLINGEEVRGLIEFDDVRGIALAYTSWPARLHPYLDEAERRLIRGRIEVVFNKAVL